MILKQHQDDFCQENYAVYDFDPEATMLWDACCTSQKEPPTIASGSAMNRNPPRICESVRLRKSAPLVREIHFTLHGLLVVPEKR